MRSYNNNKRSTINTHNSKIDVMYICFLSPIFVFYCMITGVINDFPSAFKEVLSFHQIALIHLH